MPQNRYHDILRAYNQDILNLSPANQTMRIELALEIKKILEQKPDAKVLEIGVGEGDLTKHILQHNPKINLECLDLSPEMIASAQQVLGTTVKDIPFIQDDAYNFLDKAKDNTYDIITSAWTIHNFPWTDRVKLLEKTFDALRDGGSMIMMDKIYPDTNKENIHLLKLQLARYAYLPDVAKEAITRHELEDFDTTYRMDEYQIKNILKEIGFGKIAIVDRIERDVLLTAKK